MPDAREVSPGLAIVRRTVSSVRSILRSDFVSASCFLQECIRTGLGEYKRPGGGVRLLGRPLAPVRFFKYTLMVPCLATPTTSSRTWFTAHLQAAADRAGPGSDLRQRKREARLRRTTTYRAPLVDFCFGSLVSGTSPGLALSSPSSSLRTFFLTGPGAPAELSRFRFAFIESAGDLSSTAGER